MKKLHTALFMAIFSTGLFAADAAAPTAGKAPTAAQQKLSKCESENKDMSGDDDEAGVKACMKSASNPLKAQEKISACEKVNKGKKGDEHEAAMKECLAASEPA